MSKREFTRTYVRSVRHNDDASDNKHKWEKTTTTPLLLVRTSIRP